MKLFFFFTLAFLLILIGCKENGESESSLTPKELISYLPEETNYILSIDLNTIYKAGYGEGIINAPINENSGWFTRFMYKTDLKPGKGITDIIKTDSWNGSSLFVVFLENNTSKVLEHLEDAIYFEKNTNEKIPLYKSKHGTIFLSIIDNTLISGDSLSVIYLTSNLSIEKRKTNRFSEKINFTTAEEYWFWADQPGYALAILQMLDLEIPDSTEIITTFESMKLGVKFEDGILINSVWNFTEESAAEELNHLLLKRTKTNPDNDDQDFYSDLNIIVENSEVEISLNLRDKILEKLKK